jgi:hypothetical protein
MNTCRGNRGVAPLLLNLGARRRRVVNFTFQPLYPEEEPGYLLHRTGKVKETSNVRVTYH